MRNLPSHQELEANVRRERTVDYIIVVVIWTAVASMLWRLIATRQPYLIFIAIVFVALSAMLHMSGTIQIMRLPGRRVKHLRLPEQVGAYSAAEIKRMVADLLAPHTRREIPAIYITQQADGNAFVVNSLLFNFIRPLNAIYISRRLFKILKPIEIKAILSHELGHFYHYMRPLNRTRSAIMFLHGLLPLQLAQYLKPGSFGTLIILWYAMAWLLVRVSNKWFLRHSRTYEFLSDLHAARRFGILACINGLLGVVKTAEMEYLLNTRLLATIRSDNTLSLKSLPCLLEQISEELPDGPLSTADMERAINKVLGSHETLRLHRKLTRKELDEEARQIDSLVETFLMNRKFDLIDWSEWDNANPDGRVDASEYPKLIDMLERNRDRQLFAIPTDNLDIAAHGTHPTVRERILFLEKCRRENSGLRLAG